MNVLLVTLDTTRADHLHCYGYRYIETPHLDHLAAEGILFRQATSQVPLTLPSHSSIMTGLTPVAHGVRDNGSFQLSENAITMAEVLAERGYETAAVVGAFVVHSSFGLAQGFEHYDDDFSQGRAHSEFHVVERTADQVSDAALRWLDGRRARRPFFLWVHYFDPHLTYEPPSPFRERYASSPYDGEIAFADLQLGRVLDALVEKGLWDKTLVIVMGDHGECLGEHGEAGHSLTIYEAALHVPFIVSHPECRQDEPSARWRPREVNEQVETIDLLPTVAELTGGPLPHEVEGRSLLPLLDGESWLERPAYLETMVTYITHGWAPLRGVRYEGMKLIRAPRMELYDLSSDPHELDNLADERPEEAARLGEELRLAVERAQGLALGTQDVTLAEADRERLASLGYLQAGGRTSALGELEPAELELPDPKDLVAATTQELMRGRELLAQGDVVEAERLFRLFIEVDPTSSEGHFHLALALRDQGKLDEAVDELEEAARLNPRSPKAPLHLALTNLWRGEIDEAMRWVEIAQVLGPNSAEPLAVRGNILEEQGRLEEALSLYDKSLAIDDANSTIQLARGLLLGKLGRDDEARESLAKAVALVPRDRRSLNQLAERLGKAGYADVALPLFRELVNEEPGNPMHHVHLGNCYLLAKEYQQAVEEYRTAVRLSPGEAQFHYLLGCAFAGIPDYPQARACWERTLELAPDHAEARHNLELLGRGGAP